MSKIAEIKRDYKENVEKDFSALIAEWKNWKEGDARHEEEILSDMLVILKTYFDDMRNIDEDEPWFNIEEALIEQLLGKKKYKTFHNQYQLGCFLFGLSLFGCTDLQGRIATHDYLGVSDSKCITALNIFKARLHHEDIEIDEFLSFYDHILKRLIDKAPNDFPRKKVRVKEATKAFDALVIALNEHLKCVD